MAFLWGGGLAVHVKGDSEAIPLQMERQAYISVKTMLDKGGVLAFTNSLSTPDRPVQLWAQCDSSASSKTLRT